MALSSDSRRMLGRLLVAIFALALVMGPGPGIYLINPDPQDPEARLFLFGVPVVYLWAVAWLTVQAGCVTAAWYWIWREAPGNGGESGGEA